MENMPYAIRPLYATFAAGSKRRGQPKPVALADILRRLEWGLVVRIVVVVQRVFHATLHIVDRVLDVADGLLAVALGLVFLALALQVRVVGGLAHFFLNLADDLAGLAA